MDRLTPVVIDVSDIQAAHPISGDVNAWAEDLATDEQLTQLVSQALGIEVTPLLGLGYQRFTSHAEQGVDEHTDNNPYTALLYFSTLEPGSGGELVFTDNDWRFTPTQGKAVIYPGYLRHLVTPQTEPAYRGMLALSYQEANQPPDPTDSPPQHQDPTADRAA